MEAQTKRPPPPYFAFKTLTNTIEKMEEHGPPNRVDRTFLTGMSGAAQTQFIAGLKSLGLISNDEKGIVQPALMELVNNPDDRPALIGQAVAGALPGSCLARRGQRHHRRAGRDLQGVRRPGRHGTQGDRVLPPGGEVRGRCAALAPTSRRRRCERAPEAAADAVGRPSRRRRSRSSVSNGIPTGLHPALAGLLGDIPKRGETWTQQEHDNFKVAFDAILKIAAPVSDEPDDEPGGDEGWE